MKKRYVTEEVKMLVFQPETLEEHNELEYFSNLLETMSVPALVKLMSGELDVWQRVLTAGQIIEGLEDYIEKEGLYENKRTIEKELNMDLKVSESRWELFGALPPTGIFVRAILPDNSCELVDIRYLTAESLLEWLRSCGGKNAWAENVVLYMLGHEQIAE